ncbi:hypothetical protein B566_EDAN001951 [Ephemera danica]|nr:hypothetical protein B566_EDAN001951 [Ephemera danica]
MSVLAGSKIASRLLRHGAIALPVNQSASASRISKLQLQIAGPGLQVRWKAYTPLNIGIMFVPQQEAWVVERFGKFHRIMDPGLNFLIPVVDKVKYVQSLKEIAIDIPQQSAITADNVTLSLDGVLFLRVIEPYKASYGVEDPEFSITQLAQTTMRSELGKLSLDKIFRERDIELPPRVKEAMQMQVEAERRKRATILESEGVRTADINVAEGKRQARILASEAEKQEQINRATGEAAGILALAEARAKGLDKVALALASEDGGKAASLAVAERYVEAFRQLAKTTNTVILPSNPGDISSSVVQAMAIYKQLGGSSDTTPAGTTGSKAQNFHEYYSDDEEAAAAAAAASTVTTGTGNGKTSRNKTRNKDSKP